MSEVTFMVKSGQFTLLLALERCAIYPSMEDDGAWVVYSDCIELVDSGEFAGYLCIAG
jgi:hypothetical protein